MMDQQEWNNAVVTLDIANMLCDLIHDSLTLKDDNNLAIYGTAMYELKGKLKRVEDFLTKNDPLFDNNNHRITEIQKPLASQQTATVE